MPGASAPARVLLVIDKLGRAGAQRNLALVAEGLDPHRYRAAVVGLLDGGPLAEQLRHQMQLIDAPGGLDGLPPERL